MKNETKKYYCMDCGAEMNEGERKTFTCCGACWDKHYEKQKAVGVQQRVILIFNERFEWYKEDGQYFIVHPKWSLVGMGNNLQDAHRDLLKEINITRIHFIDIPDEELTDSAKQMKYWLLPIKVKNSA